MSLSIVRYPDPRLTQPSAPVEVFDRDLQDFADALYQTMLKAPGVGITAAHVGRLLRLVIIDLPELGGRQDYVNPEILSVSSDTMDHVEGSVSMPGMTESLTRPAEVLIRYQTLDGVSHETSLKGFPAICMQHEIDQLNGIFWIDRLSRLKRERLLKKWRKVQS
ncbi:peptide deformylase [Allorhizobium sp. BGMRC 0089]|uniref:peptide deformylase n=1 Tax=Allorhizobium sonneratiae TaxID=2934936 RepID=UPI0020348A34|nr:peptide deformylase [Allorhizobium sonneratiae]MCM2292879.1 peptide deformylase [Allorhizobium sonneratiae]